MRGSFDGDATDGTKIVAGFCHFSRVGYGRTMVAAGSSDKPGYFTGQYVCESDARLQ